MLNSLCITVLVPGCNEVSFFKRVHRLSSEEDYNLVYFFDSEQLTQLAEWMLGCTSSPPWDPTLPCNQVRNLGHSSVGHLEGEISVANTVDAIRYWTFCPCGERWNRSFVRSEVRTSLTYDGLVSRKLFAVGLIPSPLAVLDDIHVTLGELVDSFQALPYINTTPEAIAKARFC